MPPPAIVNDMADLVLGRQCLGCDTPAPGICVACLNRLRGRVITLPGHDRCTISVTGYDGLGRQLVLAYKERGYLSLAMPLGWLLADSVWAAMQSCGLREAVIVPVPGHRRSRRGFDALGAVTCEAVRALRGAGIDLTQERLLTSRSNYPALKGLGRAARRSEISGAFTAVARTAIRQCVIVVDDVITTGATIDEAVTTLERARVEVAAVATIAATASPGRWARIPAPSPATRPS